MSMCTQIPPCLEIVTNPAYIEFKKIFDKGIQEDSILEIFNDMDKISLYLDKNVPMYKEVHRRSLDYIYDFNKIIKKHGLNKSIVFTVDLHKKTSFKICVLWIQFCAKICNIKSKKLLLNSLLEI